MVFEGLWIVEQPLMFSNWHLILTSIGLLVSQWMPLGINEALLLNIIFIILILGAILGLLGLITSNESILTWCLTYKRLS